MLSSGFAHHASFKHGCPSTVVPVDAQLLTVQAKFHPLLTLLWTYGVGPATRPVFFHALGKNRDPGNEVVIHSLMRSDEKTESDTKIRLQVGQTWNEFDGLIAHVALRK